MDVKVEWQEVPLDKILNDFANAFTTKDGSLIINRDWFVDVAKNKAVFKLTMVKPAEKVG